MGRAAVRALATVGALLVTLGAGVASAGAASADTPVPVTPSPEVATAPVPLVRGADGEWAFEVRLHGVVDGYVASWERADGIWTSPQEATAALTTSRTCWSEATRSWVEAFPDGAALTASAEVETPDPDHYRIDSPSLALAQTACYRASGWDWSRTPSRREAGVSVVTIPLSVVGPGRHDLFLVGMADVSSLQRVGWADGSWADVDRVDITFGAVVTFPVVVPEPTTQTTRAKVRAPTVPAGSPLAQSAWSDLAALPFRDPGADRSGTTTPAGTSIDPAAVGRWFTPAVPPGLLRTAVLALALTAALGWLPAGRRFTGRRFTGRRVTGRRVTGGRVTGGRVTGGRVTGGRFTGPGPVRRPSDHDPSDHDPYPDRRTR